MRAGVQVGGREFMSITPPCLRKVQLNGAPECSPAPVHLTEVGLSWNGLEPLWERTPFGGPGLAPRGTDSSAFYLRVAGITA